MSANNFGAWVHFAAESGLHDLVNYICTGENADTVTPHDGILAELAKLQDGGMVLDFGCGVCRNAIAFAKAAPGLQFVGYDSPQMAARADEFCRHKYGHPIADVPNLRLEADWSKVSAEQFDCVYATIVLQHVHPDEIVRYMSDIKRMTPLLVVFGRRWNDYGFGSTWSALERCGLFPANASEIGYRADGEPEEHLPPCIYQIGRQGGE